MSSHPNYIESYLGSPEEFSELLAVQQGIRGKYILDLGTTIFTQSVRVRSANKPQLSAELSNTFISLSTAGLQITSNDNRFVKFYEVGANHDVFVKDTGNMTYNAIAEFISTFRETYVAVAPSSKIELIVGSLKKAESHLRRAWSISEEYTTILTREQ